MQWEAFLATFGHISDLKQKIDGVGVDVSLVQAFVKRKWEKQNCASALAKAEDKEAIAKFQIDKYILNADGWLGAARLHAVKQKRKAEREAEETERKRQRVVTKPSIEQCRFFQRVGDKWYGRTAKNGKQANAQKHEYSQADVERRFGGQANAKHMRDAIERSPKWVGPLPRPGGFYMSQKSELRKRGLRIAKGGYSELRLCGAHAAYHGVKNVRPELRATQITFEKLLPGTMDAADDPSWEDVKRACEQHGVTLRYLRNTSPAKLIHCREGVFLVGLLFKEFEDGRPQDRHWVVYDAATGAILENMSDNDAPVVDDDDRRRAIGRGGSLEALKPFYAAFADVTQLVMEHVYAFERA